MTYGLEIIEEQNLQKMKAIEKDSGSIPLTS